MVDTMGLMGIPSLCTLGRPYICGGEEYLGVRKSHSLSSMWPSLQSLFRVLVMLSCNLVNVVVGTAQFDVVTILLMKVFIITCFANHGIAVLEGALYLNESHLIITTKYNSI